MGLFKSYSEKEVKRVMPLVKKINELELEMEKLTDKELQNKTCELKEKLNKDGFVTDGKLYVNVNFNNVKKCLFTLFLHNKKIYINIYIFNIFYLCFLYYFFSVYIEYLYADTKKVEIIIPPIISVIQWYPDKALPIVKNIINTNAKLSKYFKYFLGT